MSAATNETATGNQVNERMGEEFWTRSGSVHGPLPMQETAKMVEAEEATIADPLPLGLAGLASATFIVSAVYAGWFRLTDIDMAIPVVLIFGGIGQLLAGMWAFRRGNVLVATVLSTLGAFYASWAILHWMMLTNLLPKIRLATDRSVVEGTFMLTFCVIVAYLGVAALAQNRGLAAMLFILALSLLCVGLDTIIGTKSKMWILSLGGYTRIVAAAMAFYLSAALSINSAFRSTALPLLQAGA